MMAYSEDHIALAAEYALGTLDADERAQVETMMSVDKDFTAMVAAWEHKLARPEPDGRIGRAAALRSGTISGSRWGMPNRRRRWCLPQAPPPRRRLRRRREAAPTRRPTPPTSIQLVRHAVRRWRNVASFTTAIAAALVAMIAVQVYAAGSASRGPSPQAAHAGGRGEDAAPLPAPSAQYVAVLQKDGGSPAFILTVDGATRNFTVRKVGARRRARQEL